MVSNLAVERQTETTPGSIIDPLSDSFYADTGASSATLPSTVAYGDRSLAIANRSGGILVLSAAGGDTVDGVASVDVLFLMYCSLKIEQEQTLLY